MSASPFENRYIDLHCHGGAGYYFSDKNPEKISTAIEFHKRNGTSKLLASLVTDRIGNLHEQIMRLIPFCESGELMGIHLEGPYLSHIRCGAHDSSLLREPNLDEIKELLAIGGGHIKMMTIAPELAGASFAIEYLANQGVIPAIGHSNGGHEDALRAIDSGAQLVTHFTNGMSKLADGDRTFATALLFQSNIPLEIIFDGHHVSASDIKTIIEHASDRVVIVTDAIAAAGSPDGDYRIGSLDVVVKDSVARLKESGALAGSTLSMNAAVNHARSFGLSEVAIERSAIRLPSELSSLHQ